VRRRDREPDPDLGLFVIAFVLVVQLLIAFVLWRCGMGL
jgi:hypothetical protein